MKKILLICLLLFIAMPCFAKESKLKYVENPKEITFIYLNGAYVTDGTLFTRDVNKLHVEMKKEFEKDPLIYKNILDNGNKIINETPIAFYWGEEPKEGQSSIDLSLELMKNVSSIMSQFTRATLAHILHDAIWVNKLTNYEKIADKLTDRVNEEHAKGHDVIIFGYSAGTLINTNYATLRLRMINIEKMLLRNSLLTPKEINIVKKAHLKNTCVDAVLSSKLAYYTMNGEFEPNRDVEMVTSGIKDLNNLTEKYCIPEGTLKGVINFGNPMMIFESDISNTNSGRHNISLHMLKYAFKNDIFVLNANYAQDPIAMPMPSNPTLKEFKDNKIFKNYKFDKGFMYDKSNLKIYKPFFNAHSAYWNSPKIFAKNVVKAYNEGYNHFYGISTIKN